MTEYFNRSTEKNNRRQLRNAMPQAEVLLWARLRSRQLLGCKFRRQYSVGAFVLDFYSPEIKLGIELDGDSHFQEGKRTYDAERDAFIGSFGIKIVRFLNIDIYDNLDGVLEMIGRAILESRATASTPPDPPFVRGGEEQRARRRNAKEAGAALGRRWADISSRSPEQHVQREGSAPPDSPPYEGGARGGSAFDWGTVGTTPPYPPFVRGGADAHDDRQCALGDGVNGAPEVDGLVPPGPTTTERRGS